MAVYCADGAIRWMADDVGNPMDSGEVAYLRHAEVGVEENPGTLRCALHTGLWKSAVAPRRGGASCRNEVFVMRLFCVGFCKIGK